MTYNYNRQAGDDLQEALEDYNMAVEEVQRLAKELPRHDPVKETAKARQLADRLAKSAQVLVTTVAYIRDR